MLVLRNLQSRTTAAHLATHSSFAKINIRDFRLPKTTIATVSSLAPGAQLIPRLRQNVIIDIFRGLLVGGPVGHGAVEEYEWEDDDREGGSCWDGRQALFDVLVQKELGCHHCSPERRGACR
jgi:hypothetical protein